MRPQQNIVSTRSNLRNTVITRAVRQEGTADAGRRRGGRGKRRLERVSGVVRLRHVLSGLVHRIAVVRRRRAIRAHSVRCARWRHCRLRECRWVVRVLHKTTPWSVILCARS